MAIAYQHLAKADAITTETRLRLGGVLISFRLHISSHTFLDIYPLPCDVMCIFRH